MQLKQKSLYLQSHSGNGALAERLGTGLQNLLQRFDSARHLSKMPLKNASHDSEGHFLYIKFPKMFLYWGYLLRRYSFLNETIRIELHFGHLMIFPSFMKSPLIWRNMWPHFRHLYVMFIITPPVLLRHTPQPYCSQY